MAQAKKRPPAFHKLRARVIEALAISWIADHMDEEGELEVPREWLDSAHRMRDELELMITEELAKEKATRV